MLMVAERQLKAIITKNWLNLTDQQLKGKHN